MRDAALAAHQLGYQVRVVLRTPRAVFGGVLLPVILLALRTGDPRAVGGLCVLGVLSTAYMTHTGALVATRESGVLKRWRATPLPRAGYLAARIGATVLLAVASGIVTVVAGVLFAHAQIGLAAALALVGLLALGAVAWASIGTALSGFIPSPDAAWPVLGVTYLPLLALSGSFGAIAEPSWLSTLMEYLPAQPLIDGAARALAGTPLSARDFLVPLAWAAIGFVVARRAFRWEPTISA
jgi:ABC-2 type transport system permease protein